MLGQARELPNVLCANAKCYSVTIPSPRTGSLIRRRDVPLVDRLVHDAASQRGPVGGQGDGFDVSHRAGEGRARHFQGDPRPYSTVADSKSPNNNFTKFMTWMARLQRNLTMQRNHPFTWCFNLMIDVSVAVTVALVNHGLNPGRFVKWGNTARRGIKDPIYWANAGPTAL